MKLAIIGASGYGNTGDDTYPIIFKRYLSHFHDLTFYNSDAAAAHKRLTIYDYMIFGGGGIIYNSEAGSTRIYREGKNISAHYNYMRYYLDFAIANDIPYCFCSADIQVRRNKDNGWNFEPLKPWIRYLSKATFISVRSPHSKDILSQMCNRDVAFYPDLAYLYGTNGSSKRDNYILFIPGGTIKIDKDAVREIIDVYTKRGTAVKAASFGAYSDNKEDLDRFRKIYPGSPYLYTVSPRTGFDLVKRSIKVLTGRYHGLVFARATNTPFYVGSEINKYKIAVEDLDVDPGQAIGHIRLLREFLRKTL